MSSKLFAFNASLPVQATDPSISLVYDPAKQVSSWFGEDRVLAVYCTQAPYTGWKCSKFGSVCQEVYTGVYQSFNSECDN